jgi:hypothetical protein
MGLPAHMLFATLSELVITLASRKHGHRDYILSGIFCWALVDALSLVARYDEGTEDIGICGEGFRRTAGSGIEIIYGPLSLRMYNWGCPFGAAPPLITSVLASKL